jgi:3-deoxy-manno-octulosonate cytidylyltransferase (CMP-KDO synthetase)
MKLQIAGIIPARFASTRFPGKPLAVIDGKTMICRVYKQACKAGSLDEVYVATDDQRIFDHVREFGGNVLMTSVLHTNGTSRCEESIEILERQGKSFDVAINIQGDEPFIDPQQIDEVASCFLNPEVQIATLIKAIEKEEELFNPNIIKVVTDNLGRAIYFSRAAIPFNRDREMKDWLADGKYFKHIGIYAYRSKVLKELTRLKPSDLEMSESLEQLRWIENGYKINVEITGLESHSIDTPEDLQKNRLA